MSEVIKTKDQLDVYFSKVSSVDLKEDGDTVVGLYIPSEDLEATLKRKQRTRRVHVLSFERWKDGRKTISHMGVIGNTPDKRVYKPQVHRSPVEEIILEESQSEGS